MPALAPNPRSRRLAPRAQPLDLASGRFDKRLAAILEHATGVFCAKGYAAASMRDLAGATGMSLAGMYHYFESKERLLYLIQKQAFVTLLERLAAGLEPITDPESRLRFFIANHLRYFLAHQQGMKVLSHEATVLTGAMGREVRALRREYYRTCERLFAGLQLAQGLEWGPAEARIAVLGLFGMLNWIYTWHDRRTDADADAIAGQMGEMFLHGVLSKRRRSVPRQKSASASR